jgi:DNA repair exonuclease SbcCD ATPase subunit
MMCAKKTLGKKWTQAVITGEKTSVDAAAAFKCSIDEVEEHVYKHAKDTTEVVAVTIVRDKEYFLTQLDDINVKLQEALEIVAEDMELDTRKLTSVTKEIRETLKLLAEVSGVIGADNSAAMAQQLTEMQQKYLTLTGLILEECCPVCQKKIVDRLKGEQNVQPKEITSA